MTDTYSIALVGGSGSSQAAAGQTSCVGWKALPASRVRMKSSLPDSNLAPLRDCAFVVYIYGGLIGVVAS